MRVTMRNWQPAAGSRYQDQTRTAAPGSEAERASGIPVQTETAADRYLSTKDTAQDDFCQSIRGQVQDQTSFLNSLLGEDPEDFLASLLGKDEKSLLDSMLGKDKEEDSFLASLLGQAKESSNFKMSVSMPEDSVGQLATELARSETKMNVLQVSSKALRALGTLKIAYALSEGDDKEKIGRMIRRMQKLTRQIQKKIKNLSKEEQLQLQRKRAEERQQQEKEMEIRKEISKRKRKRRREENHYASKEVMQDRKEALQETLDSIAGLGSSSAAAAAAEGLVSAAAAGAGSGAVSAEISAAAAGGGVTAGTVSMDAAAADAAADVAV
nr:hypothetical protein [uncultured Schaedlerella sp.]